MTRLELKALMAAMIAAGHRAAETEDYGYASRDKLVKVSIADADAILEAIETPILAAEVAALNAERDARAKGAQP